MSRKIMILEDNESYRSTLRSVLSEHYEIIMPEADVSAQQALRLMNPDIECVLLSLSHTEAFELLSAKRSSVLMHPIPLIAFVDPAQGDAELKALSLDATDVTHRPTNPALLVQRVRNLIRLRENASLRRALERDPLTGIFNRHTFDKRTAKMLRKRPEEPFQLQVWDVEHFKIVNDLMGTATGDRVLRAIAKHIDEVLRGVGTYARLESDRFALCYPARLFNAQALLEGANQMLESMEIGLRIVIYAGVYNIEDIRLSVDQMCDRAGMALKTIKGKYISHSALYDKAMRDHLMLEQTVNNEMNAALLDHQFCFYLQPIYSITSGEPICAEALVRWMHPEKGMIPPKDFIPLFERNGFITKLDLYLWESVCRFLREMLDSGLTPLPISVNMSRLNLYNPHLCQDIIDMVRRYALEPAMLKLEITESAYTDNPDQLSKAVKTLREYGFQILMDDFGSGYSSLSMLKDLPVDILKVDMRFLEGMENNGRAANVMASIMRMAKWLDIIVIAEGVETHAQIDFLRSIGCDEVQGYYYSHPMSVEEYTALLADPASMRKPHNTDRERLLNGFDIQSLWESNLQTSLLFNGIIGAIGLYEKTGDILELLRVNEGYFELMGSTPQKLLHSNKNVLQKLEPADSRQLLDTCDRAVETQAVEQVQICCPHEDGHIMWLNIQLRHLGTVNKQDLFYFALSDITRQKDLERNYLLYQYGAALLDAYSEVVDMNFTDNLATGFSFNGINIAGNGYETYTSALDALLRSMLENRVSPEDAPLFIHACSREFLETSFNQQGRRSVSVELRMRSKGEQYHWVRLTLHPMDDPTGKFRALCCNRDIDEQKQNERMRADFAILQAKQNEQERYRVILEQTQTALLAWTPDSMHADGNLFAQMYRLASVSFVSLLSGNIPDQTADPEDMPSLRLLLQSLGDANNVSCLLRLSLTSGETRWCKLCVSVQRNLAGQIISTIATVNDVDREHRIQLQLDAQRAQNERRLSMLSNLYWTLPCCILQLDLNDPPQPIFFNRACWELFGYSTKDTFDAVADRDFFALIAPEEREGFLTQLRHCRDDNRVETIDITVIRPSGDRGSLHGNAAMSHTSDGKPMLQLVLLDVTQQREQDLRLELTRATLERTSDMLRHLMENLPVGVTLFEFGILPKALYINSRAYTMFGLQDNLPKRFMELVRMNAFHVQPKIDGKGMQVVDQNGVDMSDVIRTTREDGSTFWLRTYYTVVPQNDMPPLCYAAFVDVSHQVEMERAYNRQNELYRITMEDSQQIFFDYDLEKDLMNYTLRLPSGLREERVLPGYSKALRQSAIIHPNHLPGFISSLKRYSRIQTAGTHEFLADFYNTNAFHWYRAYFRSLADERGTLYRLIGRVVDIQEDKLRDEQLGQANVFRRAVDSVSLFVFAFTLPDFAPTLLSFEDTRRSGFYAYLDYLNPAHNAELIHEDERPALLETLNPQTLFSNYRSGAHELTIPFRALNRHQNWIWLEMSLHLSTGEDKNLINGIGYVKIIEDRKKLERQASFDGLTQLLNRATAEERIRRQLTEEDDPCSLLIFDVDNFKSVNDLYGHCAGDDLLREVADALRSHLRKTDIIGRLGGDEFVALLRNASETIALEKGQELLSAISQMNENSTQENRITVSIGLACSPKDGRTFPELYSAADRALYAAKRLGKNRCCSTSECR